MHLMCLFFHRLLLWTRKMLVIFRSQCVNAARCTNALQTWIKNVKCIKWRHNEHHGVWNHQHLDCLLSSSFRRTSKKTSELRVTDFYPHKGPVTRKMFPLMTSSCEFSSFVRYVSLFKFPLLCYIPIQGIYSLSGRTSYRKISWSLEAARLGVIMIPSLWDLTGISAALLPRCLSNFKAIGKV